MNSAWDRLVAQLRVLRNISSANELLGWDQHCYLPRRGAGPRAEQMATLAAIYHEKKVDDSLWETIEAAASDSALTAEQGRAVEETRKAVERARRLPTDLIRRLTQKESESNAQWIEARTANDFNVAAPLLEEIVKLKQEFAATLEPSLPAYDVLLDQYEPDATGAEIATLFEEVRPALSDLTEKLRPFSDHSQGPFCAPFPSAEQNLFFLSLSERLGFDLDRGRLDLTVHPFCSSPSIDDVRLTYRIDEADIFIGLNPLIHEMGHGFYEQGLVREQWGTPLAEACSLGIHESQSLLWEKHVLQSRAFAEYLEPLLIQRFPDAMGGVQADTLYRHANRIRIGSVRLESDEVSYGLHIIIRFELERDLVEGRIQVKDLRDAWNEKYREYLGVTPDSDLRGILQDVHWYAGLIGYFPTYLLGAMNAAQLFETWTERNPKFEHEILSGQFGNLLEWLRQSIHVHGKSYPARELMKRATGVEPSPRFLISYLGEKYLTLVAPK